jgi:2-keto-4-pentenoate hydratase/2-oxohepta-3-ene-1,7-dioic acid hydratase in catechol pathway
VRFATFTHDRGEQVGVVEGEWIVPLPAEHGDLVDVVQAGAAGLALARAALPAARARALPLDEVRLLAPLRRFRRDVLCTGWNYWDHFEESRGKREGQDVDAPRHPTFFTKGPDTVIGPADDIAYDPAVSGKWDYEAEVALVIGRTGRSIPRDRALDHVWGYTLANDVSQRDLQRAHGGQWLKGKSIDATMPLGPWIVTADEVGDPQDIRLRCLVNGELRQDASTAAMAFDVATLVSELSFGMTLHPGDLLLTGTPSGIGAAREPAVFLTEGDEVEVQADRIGRLRNRLVLRDLAGASAGRRG